MDFLGRAYSLVFLTITLLLGFHPIVKATIPPEKGHLYLSEEEKDRAELWTGDEHPDHCKSAEEFQTAMLHFRKSKEEWIPNEGQARKFALHISEGCTGATKRFSTVMKILYKSGVDHHKCFETALKFSTTDDDTVENFSVLFKKLYLGEFFDLDYQTAINLSFEISTYYKGNRKIAREDFLNLSKFCLNKKELNLPTRTCAGVAIRIARLSKYYPHGVTEPFLKLFETLRSDKKLGVSIRTAFEITLEVLPHGPMAPTNFLTGYEYAISKTGLGLPAQNALQFAKKMANLSSREGTEPPVYYPPKVRARDPYAKHEDN